MVLSGYSGYLVYELGLIDIELSFEETRVRDLINWCAEVFADWDDFSLGIRQRADSSRS